MAWTTVSFLWWQSDAQFNESMAHFPQDTAPSESENSHFTHPLTGPHGNQHPGILEHWEFATMPPAVCNIWGLSVGGAISTKSWSRHPESHRAHGNIAMGTNGGSGAAAYRHSNTTARQAGMSVLVDCGLLTEQGTGGGVRGLLHVYLCICVCIWVFVCMWAWVCVSPKWDRNR